MSAIGGLGAAGLNGQVNISQVSPGAAGAAGGAGASQAGAAGQGGASAAGAAQQAGAGLDTGTVARVHQQVSEMLGQIDTGLQMNQMLRLMIALMVLQALNGGGDNEQSNTGAAALAGAAAGASLAALNQTHQAMHHLAPAAQTQPAVQAGAYSQQAHALNQPLQPTGLDLKI